MSFDSDVALVGTGAAPLVAATHLLAEGKSVLLLNPDWDFFLEDSELPFDPMSSGCLDIDSGRLRASSAEEALKDLRPGFPGAVEYWAGADASGSPSSPGYRDLSAPYLRARSRLWVTNKEHSLGQGDLEDLYVLASDAGYSPQILEGLQVSKRFPGASLNSGNSGNGGSGGGSEGTGEIRGLWVPKVHDIDVTRYRNGLLEFVRDRSGPGRGSQVVCNAKQIEIMQGGIRFHSDGRLHTARLTEGMLVFWTPRMTQWVLSQARRSEITPVLPKGIRLWEQWSLLSRYVIDPNAIGVYGNLAVWAEMEGHPAENVPVHRLAMLRSGPMIGPLGGASNLFDSDSFNALGAFFYGFLKWERVTVRAMKSRAVFEWETSGCMPFSKGDPRAKVVMGCDGPLADVVRVARRSCSELGV